MCHCRLSHLCKNCGIAAWHSHRLSSIESFSALFVAISQAAKHTIAQWGEASLGEGSSLMSSCQKPIWFRMVFLRVCEGGSDNEGKGDSGFNVNLDLVSNHSNALEMFRP